MTNDSHNWNVLVLAPSSPLELWNPSDKSQIFRGMREEKTHTTNWTADITMKQSRLLVGEVKSFSSLSFLKIFFVKASLWSTVINNKVIFPFFLPTEAAHLQRASEYTALCIIFTFLSRHWHFSAIHIQSLVKGVIFLMWCQKKTYYIHWSPTNHLKKKNISGERRKNRN